MQRQGANKEVIMDACIRGNYVQPANGYSYMYYKGKNVRQHRVAYCEAKGLSLEDIKGKVVRHICDVKWCVNPKHLLLGTQQDNMNDMLSRGRHVTPRGTANGNAALTSEQVQQIRTSYVKGSRVSGQRALGRQFGVNSTTILSIVHGHTWQHLEDSPCNATNG